MPSSGAKIIRGQERLVAVHYPHYSNNEDAGEVDNESLNPEDYAGSGRLAISDINDRSHRHPHSPKARFTSHDLGIKGDAIKLLRHESCPELMTNSWYKL